VAELQQKLTRVRQNNNYMLGNLAVNLKIIVVVVVVVLRSLVFFLNLAIFATDI